MVTCRRSMQAPTDLPSRSDRRAPTRPRCHDLLCLALLLLAFSTASADAQAEPPNAAASGRFQVYLPSVRASDLANPQSCPATGTAYEAIAVPPPPTDRPAPHHADLNLALRGWSSANAYLGLVDIGGDTHADPPQLRGVFPDHRTPRFCSAAQVYDWNWACGADGCRGQPITEPQVTLLGLAAQRDEPVRSPSREQKIDNARGYTALVLYAEEERITLKYTLNDNVISGYTVHMEGVCVDPELLALYRRADAAGRGQLPALRNDQPLGRVLDNEVRVAIRDTGTFLDPRSRKDWWQR